MRHSQVLIALWDGVEARGTGGTAEVVGFMTRGIPDRYSEVFDLPSGLLDPVESGRVYHILTPHAKNPLPEGKAFEICPLVAGGDRNEALDRIFAHVEGFNRDVRCLDTRSARDIKIKTARLFPDADAMVLCGALQSLRERFGLADTLANHFQRLTYRTLGWLFALVFVAIVLFGFYAHLAVLSSGQFAFLGLYLTVLAVAIAWFRVADWRNWQNKHQDYRALAEGLRVQFFWAIAGLSDSVADHYLHRQKSELDWIRHAIRAWGTRVLPMSGGRLEAVISHWVGDQRGYFERAAHRDSKHLMYLAEIGAGLLLVSFGIGALEVFSVLPPHAPEETAEAPLWIRSLVGILGVPVLLLVIADRFRALRKHKDLWEAIKGLSALVLGVSAGLALTFLVLLAPRHLPAYLAAHLDQRAHEWWIVAMVLTAAIPALLHAYGDKRALAEHEKQYKHMASLFARAQERLQAHLHDRNPLKTRTLIFELGKDALAEHGDWVLLHRERPIEPPRAEL